MVQDVFFDEESEKWWQNIIKTLIYGENLEKPPFFPVSFKKYLFKASFYFFFNKE